MAWPRSSRLGLGEVQDVRHIQGQQRQPGPPDHVFQEHHDRQAGCSGHGWAGTDYSATAEAATADETVTHVFGRLCYSWLRTFIQRGGG